jgi:hypothetical protein
VGIFVGSQFIYSNVMPIALIEHNDAKCHYSHSTYSFILTIIGRAMTLLISTAQTCPLCQQTNGCAMEQGLGINACWCDKQAQHVPSVIAQYKATSTLPTLADNQCICQSCMAKLVQQFNIDPVETYLPSPEPES